MSVAATAGRPVAAHLTAPPRPAYPAPDAPSGPLPVGDHPPRARLALNVGILASDTDGVPGLLPAAASAQLDAVLADARAAVAIVQREAATAFAAAAPILRVVTSLTTSRERAAATLALGEGFALQAVLPCPRETLLAHLPDADQAVLLDLLSRADAVLELDGTLDRSTAAREAGEAMADVVLDQSDLLVMLGDTNDGASQRVWYARREAAARELTQVTISDTETAALTIIVCDRLGTPAPTDHAGLQAKLVNLLRPPVATGAAAGTPLAAYAAESMPRLAWLAWTWTLFLSFVADGRLRWPRLRFNAADSATKEWDRSWGTTPPLPTGVHTWLDRGLRAAYVWPDALSIYYAGAFRGSFVVTTLLSTATVLIVLLAYVVGGSGTVISDLQHVASIAFVLAIIAVASITNRRRWHERWLDYRMLAELLRQLRFLAPLGRVPRFARLPAHDAPDDPRGTWMAWQAHSVARDLGLVTARVDRVYRAAYLAYLRDGLITGIAPDTGQRGYHDSASRRFARLELRSADLKVGLMWAAIAVSLFELGDRWLWLGWNLPSWFSALIAVFAGLGGAISSLAGQADAGRIKKRSAAMRERLDHLRTSLDRPEAAASAAVLGEVAAATADAMLAELTDYRLVFQGKPLKYPG